MIDRLKTTMNEAQIKQLVEAAASQAQQQQQQSSSGKSSSSQSIDPLHVSSYNSMIKLAELQVNSANATSSIAHHNSPANSYNDIKLPKSATINVQQPQQQLFEALSTSEGASFDSQSAAQNQLQSYILQTNHLHNHHPQQQQQQHQQQHQHSTNNSSSTTAHQNQQQQQHQNSHQSTSMVSTNTLNVNLLLQENQKLANIARVCIHLIDRCRNLNKSKHFASDLEKLSTMIDAFNTSASSYFSGALPVLDNIGALIFKFQQNGGQNNVAAVPATSAGVNYSAATLLGVSSGSNDLLSRNANTLWLQLNSATAPGTNIDQQQQQQQQGNPLFNDQPTFIQQQVNTDSGPIQILKPVQVQSEFNGNSKLSNTPGAIKQRKRAQNTKLRLNQLRMQMVNNAAVAAAASGAVDATQQSILFKKLTQAEQLSAVVNSSNNSLQNGNSGGGGQAGSGGGPPPPPLSVQMMDFAGSIHDSNTNPSSGQTVFSLVAGSNLNGNSGSTNNSNGDSNNNDIRDGKPRVKVEFKCQVCDKHFANLYNLNRHGRTHSGFPPFTCPYQECRKRFNYSYHLKRHIDTHLGTRNFPCTWPNCDQRFSRKYNLHRHLWVHTENAKMSSALQISS